MAKRKIGRKSKQGPVSSSSGTPTESTPEMKRLDQIFRLMASHGLAELELEDAAGRLHVRMPSAIVAAPQMTYAAPAAPAAVASAPASPSVVAPKDGIAKPATLPANQKKILSPFVGTFYRASNPNAAPYAKEGQAIKKGQTLCIIEAMKLMNEIESEFEGKIVTVLVENGQPVEFGEPLFIIEA